MGESSNQDEVTIRDTFEFASVIHFLYLFLETLDLDDESILPPTMLEEIIVEQLEDQEENETRLAKLLRQLCRKLHKARSPNDEFVCKTVAREYRRYEVEEPFWLRHKHSSDDELAQEKSHEDNQTNKMEHNEWSLLKTLTPTQRLRILFDLCSFQIQDVDQFRSHPHFHDPANANEWRLSSEGPDKNGLTYWLIAGCWLYSQKTRLAMEKIDQESTSRTKKRQKKMEVQVCVETWKCLAWTVDTWKSFILMTPLRTSRKQSDREIYNVFSQNWQSIALETLEPWERKRQAELRRKETELYRQALYENRKRSSRLLARERLQQQLASSPETTRSSEKESIPSRNLPASPNKMSREERMARRERLAVKREADALVEELLQAQAQSLQELADNANNDASSFDDMNGLSPIDEEVEIDVDEDIDEDDGDKSNPQSEDIIPKECRSPIKLVLKMTSGLPVQSTLIIGDELVTKSSSLQPDDDKGNKVNGHFQPESNTNMNIVDASNFNREQSNNFVTDKALDSSHQRDKIPNPSPQDIADAALLADAAAMMSSDNDDHL